jgi:hypothetical protein
LFQCGPFVEVKFQLDKLRNYKAKCNSRMNPHIIGNQMLWAYKGYVEVWFSFSIPLLQLAFENSSFHYSKQLQYQKTTSTTLVSKNSKKEPLQCK